MQPLDTLLESLCWMTQRYQDFPRRWQLIAWLKQRENLLSNLPPKPRSVARGQDLYIDPSDFDGSRYLINGLNPREPISNVMIQLVSEGDYVLDIGANVGYFTVLNSLLIGSQGRVFSIPHQT